MVQKLTIDRTDRTSSSYYLSQMQLNVEGDATEMSRGMMVGRRRPNPEIAGTKSSRWTALPTAVLLLSTCGGLASAETIHYNSYSFPYYDNISIHTPNNVSGGAGQIILNGVTASSFL